MSQGQNGNRGLDCPGKGKWGFSLAAEGAELLNQLHVFSFVLPWPGPAEKAVGGWMSLLISSPLFGQTYIQRANCWRPGLSSPQEEGFVQQLNQAV